MENKKRSFVAVLSLLLLLLIAFNGASIFSIKIPYPENVAGDSKNLVSVSSSLSNLMYAVEEENPSGISETQLKSPRKTVAGGGDFTSFNSVPYSMHDVQQQQHHIYNKETTADVRLDTHLPLLRKSHSLPLESEDFPVKRKKLFEVLSFMEPLRFFMTWISPLNSFGAKELHSIETVFNTHPHGCLLILSNTMDSNKGREILKPFTEKGFRVTAISPDLHYLFKNTMADSWFFKLTRGDLDAGFIPFGQNLSNLLRLCLLHKFGGVYMDTDVMILKSFSKLRNSIGAQTLDLGSKNWSRLNNAVMVFDKMHPLVYKFIEEFEKFI